jgi:hypothetical protein
MKNFVVVLGIVAGTSCTGTTITMAQGDFSNSAPPRACSAAITRLANAFNEALVRGRPLVTAPQSVGAMLHHQPTRDSVAMAESESFKRVKDSLATARELRSERRRSQCALILKKVALSAGVR